MISSANLKLLRYSPLIMMPVSHSILLTISSSVAVNINGDLMVIMYHPCLALFIIWIFLLLVSLLTCAVPPFYVLLRMLMAKSHSNCLASYEYRVDLY